MTNSEAPRITPISQASTVAQIAGFWDTHSLAEHWDEITEVDVEVGAQRRRRVTLDPDLYTQIESQAQLRGLLPETLINLWLAERLHAAET